MYAQQSVTKQEEISWVYLNGKLYLRSPSKDMGTLEIINPETLRTEAMIGLHCPEIFQHNLM